MASLNADIGGNSLTPTTKSPINLGGGNNTPNGIMFKGNAIDLLTGANQGGYQASGANGAGNVTVPTTPDLVPTALGAATTVDLSSITYASANLAGASSRARADSTNLAISTQRTLDKSLLPQLNASIQGAGSSGDALAALLVQDRSQAIAARQSEIQASLMVGYQNAEISRAQVANQAISASITAQQENARLQQARLLAELDASVKQRGQDITARGQDMQLLITQLQDQTKLDVAQITADASITRQQLVSDTQLAINSGSQNYQMDLAQLQANVHAGDVQWDMWQYVYDKIGKDRAYSDSRHDNNQAQVDANGGLL